MAAAATIYFHATWVGQVYVAAVSSIKCQPHGASRSFAIVVELSPSSSLSYSSSIRLKALEAFFSLYKHTTGGTRFFDSSRLLLLNIPKTPSHHQHARFNHLRSRHSAVDRIRSSSANPLRPPLCERNPQ